MAPSKAAPSTTAAVGGGSTTSTTGSQTIVASRVLRIDGFSATKDLGVGKSIKSSTFRVGGHGWYIECYPCGHDEESAGWVTLFLCRQRQDDDDHGSPVSGYCEFTLMGELRDGGFQELIRHPSKLVTLADDDRYSLLGTEFMERESLEWFLEDDCFQVRCVVFMEMFVAAPPPNLATDETVAGSHVLTVVDGYSKTRRAFVIGEAIESSKFRVGGHTWCLAFYPWGEDEDHDDDRVSVSLFLVNPGSSDEVKVRYEITLLTHAGQIISSIQDFGTFSEGRDEYIVDFITLMEHESSPLLQDGIQIRCDIALVNAITATPNLQRGIGGGDIQASEQVRGDVTFEVAGHLFAAHKFVLTARCAAFMAEFFGPAGNESAGGVTQLRRIDNMEPEVFKAFLRFIYTDSLPEVHEDNDKIVMAQGLLVVADRYAIERLRFICCDMLYNCVNDARTAVDMLELADEHGCRRLKEKCIKLLKDHFAMVGP